MLVLFDNGTPRTLARYLIEHHAVMESRACGWQELEHGDLLNKPETTGFEVLLTTKKNSAIKSEVYWKGARVEKIPLNASSKAAERRQWQVWKEGSYGKRCP